MKKTLLITLLLGFTKCTGVLMREYLRKKYDNFSKIKQRPVKNAINSKIFFFFFYLKKLCTLFIFVDLIKKINFLFNF